MDGKYGGSGTIRPPPGLHVKEFVPSSASSAAAKPFVPAGSSGGLAAGAPSFAPSGSAGSSTMGSKSVGAAAFQPAASKRPTSGGASAANSAHGLPEGDDDLLGLSSTAAGAGSNASRKDLSSQAAEMFKAFKPFQPSTAGGAATAAAAAAPAPAGVGRGRGGPPPGASAPGLGGRGYPGPSQPGPGGRGSGRSRGRGRGVRGGPIGPGLTRPSVAAYAVSHGRMQLAGKFMSETVRQDMQQRSYLQAATMDADSLTTAGLPQVVQQYHTLCPLEDPEAAAENPSVALGVVSYVFKGVHYGDGAAYALRRLDGRQVLPTAELLAAGEAAVERWGPVSNHPNIVGLREIFVSDEVDTTPALFLSYDYHPGALTLEQAHMLPTHTAQGMMRNPVTESQLWSYLVQLTAALRAVHTAGLAAAPATLVPSKVLLMAPSRVRLGAIGAAEVLAEGPPADVAAAQREDLTALGSLLLNLACSAKNAPPTLDALSAHYSRELCHVIAGLLASSDGGGFASWRSLVSALGDRIFTELESSESQVDTLSTDMQKECENGRLLRLMLKLNMVLERPELLGDTRWAETADRYLLTLFRDFVFHQVSESGAPAMDWGPIIDALNKADAGIEEKIVLLSRDEASMLVVSYADVKRCLLTAYGELKAAAKSGGGGGGMGEGGPYS